jgi:hypothetical protein
MKEPRSIAVDSGFVYYADKNQEQLRYFPKEYDGKAKESTVLRKFKFEPQDIIVRSSFVTDLNSELCKPVEVKVEVTTQVAVKETTEACACREQVCEVDKCNNFCLNDGKCSIIKNEAKCACKPRFAGDRCEVDKCTNFCFNGKCSIDSVTKEPRCSCDANFTGKRCETSIQKVPETSPVNGSDHHADKLEECPQNHIDYSHMVVAVCVLLSLVVFLVILLVLKKMQRPQRPRVKKTFKVHKNIEPLTYRPHTEHCEVVIEDCCNMNICETVSFKILRELIRF